MNHKTGPYAAVHASPTPGGVVQLTDNDYGNWNPQVSGDRVTWYRMWEDAFSVFTAVPWTVDPELVEKADELLDAFDEALADG
ncbi:MAG: hypothetical protein RQ731_04055 [Anaerosomatales bacterium]|nr:hypothetical protein [Anaerosomatales bacterium]MDT8433916.1 hypothetical protein [Anaerosomatales bacterium]